MSNHHNLHHLVQDPTRCKHPRPTVHHTPESSRTHDHLVIADTSLKATINAKRPRNIQLFNKADWDKIRNDLNTFEESFFTGIPSNNTVDQNWGSFKTTVLNAINKWVPAKKSKSNNDLPWMTREAKHLKRRKEKTHSKAKRTKSDHDWARFRHIRKALRQHMKRAYVDYINNLVDPEKDEGNKNLWRYLKSQKQDHVGVVDAAGKADILNRQFSSVFTQEQINTMPDKGASPYPNLPRITITRNGVEALLQKVKPKKASGPDLIPARFLHEMAEPLSVVLSFIFQQSLDSGTVPNDWRTANVVPIFKKGDRGLASNYRPVSLTALACKIMEHIVVSSILDHLDAHNILSDLQHGFRAKRSCETQLTITTQDVASALNRHCQVDMAVLDFSKAFDKVPHQRILHKLRYYGVTDSALAWIGSFLSGRSQQVVVDGAMSSQCPVLSGVPQGTVLGPLLTLVHQRHS